MRNVALLFAVLLPSASAALGADDPRPNFIIVFTNDHGYGDLGCFGSPEIETPCIDRMADEGIRFTCFYAAPFCGPSRAALMTGCYPPRPNLAFNHGPNAKTPHEFFYYFGGTAPNKRHANLRAIRDGGWKLHLAMNQKSGRLRGTELYDLYGDVSETRDQSGKHPELVEKLVSAAQKFNDELSKNRRPLGRLPEE